LDRKKRTKYQKEIKRHDFFIRFPGLPLFQYSAKRFHYYDVLLGILDCRKVLWASYRLRAQEKQTNYKQIGKVIRVAFFGSFRIRLFNDTALRPGAGLVFKREKGIYLAVVTENYALHQDKTACFMAR